MPERGYPTEEERFNRTSPEQAEVKDFSELVIEEEKLVSSLHERTDNYLRKNGIKKIPAWLKRGVLLAGLFEQQTALARDAADNNLHPQNHEAVVANSNPDVNADVTEALVELLNEPGANFEIFPAPGTSEVSSYLITADQASRGKAFVFDFPISRVVFHHDVLQAAPPAGVWDTVTASDSMPFFVADKDTPTAHLSVESMQKPDGPAEELIFVALNENPGQTGQDLINLDVDWEQVGLPNLDSVFYYRPPSVVGEVAGLPVVSGADNRQEVKKLIDKYDGNLTEGIYSAQKLFGLTESPISSIVVENEAERNAGMRGTELNIFDDILKKSLPEDAAQGLEGKMTGTMIEGIAEHETFHAIDYKLGICNDPSIRTFFDLSSRQSLELLNEKNFSGDFGGHAQANESEMFASLMNDLDSQNWEEHVDGFSPDDRAYYIAALTTVLHAFQNNDQIPDSAPVFGLLKDRLEYLTAAN